MSVERYLRIDGANIRCIISDGGESQVEQKPTIVLFHGYSYSADDWSKLGTINLLSKQGYRVYAIDLPEGRASRSDRIRFGNVKQYVPILERIFRDLNLPNNANGKKLVIVGPSLGGTFALAYSIAHPEEIAGLVLIAPVVETIELDNGNLIVNFDLPRFSAHNIQVLLVWGERDTHFPPSINGTKLNKDISNSRLVVLEQAGHAANIDAPEKFNSLLLDFLRKLR